MVLLAAGLWTAQFPEVTLRWLQRVGEAMQDFVDGFRGPGAPYLLPQWHPDSLTDSRGAILAMRCFGVAIAAAALAGLFGVGRR